MSPSFTRFVLLSCAVGALAACSQKSASEAPATPSDIAPAETTAAPEAPVAMTLEAAVSNSLRKPEDMVRDASRHPAETLAFFGIVPDMTVVEIWPGNGWYTDILAPFLASGGGTLYAAHFEGGTEARDARLQGFRDKYMTGDYGDVQLTTLSAASGPVAPNGSADLVLTFRNVHNWMGAGFADKAFADFYAALKPGGVLGVVEHRLPESRDSADEKTSGYVKTTTVIALAEAAGFEYVGESAVNANPADTADHPFGVWTLPPVSRTSDRDGNAPEGFDAEKYKAIGESDRMTLKFRKPVDAEGALLE